MNKINVLIVDDHRIIINGIKTMLEDIDNINIIGEASNGQEALSFVESNPNVNVVLMDIRMPIKNGIEATKELLVISPNIKILALTMFEEDEFISSMLQAGAIGYVLKHTSKNELIQAIERVSVGEPFFSHEIAKIVMARFLGGGGKQPNSNSVAKNQAALDAGLVELTEREMEILRLIASQLTNQEIADKLFISSRTVHSHRRNLMQKIGVKNTAGLVRYSYENKILN